MKKCILLPVALLAVLAIGGGAAVMTGALSAPELQAITNTWGDVDEERTEVHTSIVLHNPNNIGIGLGNAVLEVDILLNGVQVGQGSLDSVELPQGESTTRLVTVIDNMTIPAWWATHVDNGEHTTVRIEPAFRASLFGRSLGVGVPSVERDVDTDVLASVHSDQPETFPFGPFTLTMKEREFEWGEVSGDSTEIVGELVLHQDSPAPVAVSRLDFTFVMNEVTVAEATTSEPTVLPPDQDTRVPFSANVDNARLLEWWPTHIENDERTDYRVEVDMVLDVEETALSSGALQDLRDALSGSTGSNGVRIPLDVIEFSDEFETDILGSKGEE